jgi:hypothetical protein
MGLPGRYYSERDLKLIYSVNRELLHEIIECVVTVFKVSVYDTNTNLYGEADTKSYLPGIELFSLIEHPDTTTENEDFGPDKTKTIQFRFNENYCKEANVYPEIGDVILWDYSYYEITNVIQEQHLGGIADKSWSIIVDTHLSRLSRLNIEERQL